MLQMPKTEMITFDGDPTKFRTFMEAFKNNVGKYRVDEHAKLARLLQYCKGKAYKLVEACAAMECGRYQRAKELLHERFGDAYAISTAWLNKITGGPKVNNESLQEFADELLHSRETLNAIGCLSEVNQRVLVQVVERLPTYLQHRRRYQVSKLRKQQEGSMYPFRTSWSFVQMAAREVNDPVFGSLGQLLIRPMEWVSHLKRASLLRRANSMEQLPCPSFRRSVWRVTLMGVDPSSIARSLREWHQRRDMA